jgi:acetyltransferase-like isoleucine patch superfamily enzyme
MAPTQSGNLKNAWMLFLACWIATGATVLPGVTIHEGGVVGACALVSRDVAPWTVVAGNPARFVKNRRLADPEQNGGACHLPS